MSDYSKTQPFRFWCQKVLPLVYDDSLSYYELLCKVVDYLNKVNSNINSLIDEFNNLDINDAVSKKLDKMASDGSLDKIINQEIFGIITGNKLVLIGDSYLEGYNPDGNVQSWGQQLKRLLNISDDDYYEFYHGGYGFATGTASFNLLADNAIETLGDDSDKVKNVIIGGGFNDAYSTRNIRSNMQIVLGKLKSAFPNARISIAPIGWCCQGKTSGTHVNQTFANLINMTEAYQIGALENGCCFVPNSWCALHNNAFFGSDYVHPNANGQYSIALMLCEYLNNLCNDNFQYLKKLPFTAENATGVTGTIQGNYTIDGEHTFITISKLDIKLSVDSLKCSGVKVKIGKVVNAGIYGNNNISFQAGAIVGSNSGRRWDTLPCVINIINQEMFISFQGTTDDKTNFLTLTNVISIAVYGLITSVTGNLQQ